MKLLHSLSVSAAAAPLSISRQSLPTICYILLFWPSVPPIRSSRRSDMNDSVWSPVPSHYGRAAIPDRSFTDKQREVSLGSVVIPHAAQNQRPISTAARAERDRQFQLDRDQQYSQYRRTFELIKSDRNPQLNLMQLMFNPARDIGTELLHPSCSAMGHGDCHRFR